MRYLFEDYALDTDRRELRRGGTLVAIEPQVFDLLAYLVQHGDRVVTKDDLFTAVWNGRFVSESALTTRINAARTALGDDGKAQRLLRTLRGRGVRFVGDVRVSRDATSSTTAEAPPTLALPDRPSIAVLPFDNMSGDPEQEYFADGMVEDILTALSRVRWLFVIARHSSFIYKGRAADVQQIGRELGVRYVVEGSVRKSGNRVRIIAQLIEAETGAHIWADRYDGDLSDIFALQDEITERIVTAVEPTVRTVEIKRALAKPTDSLTAYDSLSACAPVLLLADQRGSRSRRERSCARPSSWTPSMPRPWAPSPTALPIAHRTGWYESRTRAIDEACELAVAPWPRDRTTAHALRLRRSPTACSPAVRGGVRAGRSGDQRASQFGLRAQSGRRGLQRLRRERQGDRPVRGSAAHEPARQQDGHLHLHGRHGRALLGAPLRGEHPRGKARVGIHSEREYRPQECCRIPRPAWPHRRGAGRDRRAPQAPARRFACAPANASFRHKWMHELHLEGLRKAGLREN